MPRRKATAVQAVDTDALTDMQKAFAAEYVKCGGNGTEAARRAGYSAATANVQASQMMRKPLILQAIHAETVKQISAHAPAALHRIAELSSSARSEYVQLEASKDLLDRAGFKPIDRQQLMVDAELKVSIDLG